MTKGSAAFNRGSQQDVCNVQQRHKGSASCNMEVKRQCILRQGVQKAVHPAIGMSKGSAPSSRQVKRQRVRLTCLPIPEPCWSYAWGPGDSLPMKAVSEAAPEYTCTAERPGRRRGMNKEMRSRQRRIRDKEEA